MRVLLLIFFIFDICALIKAVKAPKINGVIELQSFSKDATVGLKGILAIGIILSHLQAFCFRPHHYWLSSQFTVLAQVGVFFFISGYGLCYAYQKNGPDYLRGFLSKRVLRVLVPMLIATICFLTAYDKWCAESILSDMKVGDTPLPYSWFCYIILIYYIWFYISALVLRDIRFVIVSMFIPTVLCYILMGDIWHWGDWWYRSNLGFNLGMIVKYFEVDIRKVFERYPIPILLIVPFGLFCIYAGGHFHVDMEIQAVGFSLLILALVYVFGFRQNRVTQWLGKYSYEIYLTHGMLIPLYPYWPIRGGREIHYMLFSYF